MNVNIYLNGADVTSQCLLSATRIRYDTSRRISTASITLLASGPAQMARYDYAHYDQDVYGIDIRELYTVTIRDGRDASKMFEGRVHRFGMRQTDAPGLSVAWDCDLNDWSSLLDRSAAWDSTFLVTMPSTDKAIIQRLMGQFCTQIDATDVAVLTTVINSYDWKGKTMRQVLDDLSLLGLGEYWVDYDKKLHYKLAADAAAAPFGLSTSPNNTTTFPVRVENWTRDFQTPVNSAFVRGAAAVDLNLPVQAFYKDPVSIATYGELQAFIVDDQLTDNADAQLRAKTMVLRYANPIQAGSFVIWKDGLKIGQRVHVREDALGVDGDFIIRTLELVWKDQDQVEYRGDFGAAQPDLETYLRMLDQRTKWKTSKPQVGVPANGSITDASIAFPGLGAGSIQSVNAGAIVGSITAGQIGSVNATAILGSITAGQIGSVNATAINGQVQAGQIGSVNAVNINGSIEAGQIGSVNATTINGVIVTDQLANGIIDDLAKYAAALRPVPMLQTVPTLPNDNNPPGSFFFYIPDGHFYQINGAGTGWSLNDSPENVQMKFYHIGAVSAQSITGLILAAQIDTITAGDITGKIQANQIGTIDASTITVGQIQAAQIKAVDASTITIGTIQGTQITAINAATITIGSLQDTQIGNVSGGKLIAGTVTSAKLNATNIDCGGGASMPGVIRVLNASSAVVARMGDLTGGFFGGWFQVFGAGGTQYSDAKIRSDTSGNLGIYDAGFTITNSGSGTVLSTGPAVFDSSYNSLKLQIAGGSDQAVLVSRGLVVTYGGTTVVSCNRSPTAGCGEVVVGRTGSGNQIILAGSDASVRADGGFSVAGAVGANGVFTMAVGTKITVTKGIVTSVV